MKHLCTLLLAVTITLLASPSSAQTVKTLLAFTGSATGQNSEGNLIWDSAGNLYGTTGDQFDPSVMKVFQLHPNSDGTWTENVLWSSTGGAEPNNIRAGVIFDASGNLYGTSINGGQYDCGTVFKLTHNADGTWSEGNLFDFDCGNSGNAATGGVIFDTAGNLYGTTSFGGTSNWGVVYKLSPNADGSWSETVLHNFTFGSDGGYPGHGSLVFDSKGALYGTAGQGAQGNCFVWTTGCGTVYKLTPKSDGTWAFKVIHSFTGGNDGGVPQFDLKFDKAGNLYSTAYMGGKYNDGVVFELVAHTNGTWSEKVLHHFRGGDGMNPFGGVTFDSAGNLYGTTAYGGTNQCFNAPGCGVVYELTPNSTGSWTEKTLVHFHGTPNDGPYNDLLLDSSGNLYGVATDYGTYSYGGVYEVVR